MVGHDMEQEDEMTLNMFLKMDGIQGEAQDKGYRDTIEVLGWGWGVSQTLQTPPSPGTGGAAGRPSIQNFSITKCIDKATPKIYELAFQGRQIKECRFTCCKKEGEIFLEIVMSNCVLVSVLTGGKNDEDRITETLLIHFSTVEITYYFKDASGKPMPIKSGWDSTRNTPV
jgi:type VI secretion system secreted protein Hcp